jgi:hypothetical protein
MMPDALSKFGRISDHQLSFFFIVWLFLPVNSLSQAVAPSRGKLSAAGFRIAGTVVNSVTGASLTQARVALVDTKNPANVFQVFTSENGHFDFSNLSAGKYSLQGAKSGYLPAAYDQHEQFSTAIVTGPDFRTDQLILRLTPMAIIAGHVIDEAGEPVRKAIVTSTGGALPQQMIWDSTIFPSSGPALTSSPLPRSLGMQCIPLPILTPPLTRLNFQIPCLTLLILRPTTAARPKRRAPPP